MRGWRIEIAYKKSGKLVYALETVHESKAEAERVKRGLDASLDHDNYRTRIVRV